MTSRPILLVEDNPRDVELTIEALKLSNMLNEIVVVNAGQEALDYLRRDGRLRQPAMPTPASCCSTSSCRR